MKNDCSLGVTHDLKDAAGQLTMPVHTETSWLLLRLFNRGVAISVDGPDLVITGTISEAERAALRRLKRHVRHLLAYIPPEVH